MATENTRDRSRKADECARSLLEEARSQQPAEVFMPAWDGLPRRTPEELDALAIAQGASLEANLDELRGDFWPADESSEEFIAAIRQWRREGLNDRLPPSGDKSTKPAGCRY
jgi:hypothetical protein